MQISASFVKNVSEQIFWAYQLDAISQAPKNPLPLALVMDLHASKTLRSGPYES
jgi:hypothetical protein